LICEACGKETHHNLHKFILKNGNVIYICDNCFLEWFKIYVKEKLWRNFDRYGKRFKIWLKEKQEQREEEQKVKFFFT